MTMKPKGVPLKMRRMRQCVVNLTPQVLAEPDPDDPKFLHPFTCKLWSVVKDGKPTGPCTCGADKESEA